MRKSFKPGDQVCIINPSNTYDMYEAWYKKYHIPGVSYPFHRGLLPNKGAVGTVIAVGSHEHTAETLVLVNVHKLPSESYSIVIGEEGLELKEKTFKEKTEEEEIDATMPSFCSHTYCLETENLIKRSQSVSLEVYCPKHWQELHCNGTIFEVGDIVEITDFEQIYTMKDAWLATHAPGNSDKYKHRLCPNGYKGVILAIAPTETNSDLLAAVHIHIPDGPNEVTVISLEGLKLIKRGSGDKNPEESEAPAQTVEETGYICPKCGNRAWSKYYDEHGNLICVSCYASNGGFTEHEVAVEKAVEKAVVQGATQVSLESNENKEEESEMKMNLKSIFGDIGKDISGKFKLSMMGLAVKNHEGKFVCYDGTKSVDVMDMVMDIKDAIFRIPVLDVSKGDLIINQGKYALYVESKNADGSLNCFDPMSDRRTTYVPQGNIFGFNFFIKVISIFNLGQQMGNEGQNNMIPLVLAMAMKDDEDNDMVTLMLMSQLMGGQGGAMNNMLPMLFFMGDDKGNSSDMVKLMMFSQMMGGQGASPFAGFNMGFNNQMAPAKDCNCKHEVEKDN